MTDVIIFHFGPFFAFYPPNSQKNQNKKMKKMPGDIIISHKCTKYPEIWSMTNVIVIFHFGLFFALLQTKNQNFIKMKKKAWRYHHFTYV